MTSQAPHHVYVPETPVADRAVKDLKGSIALPNREQFICSFQSIFRLLKRLHLRDGNESHERQCGARHSDRQKAAAAYAPGLPHLNCHKKDAKDTAHGNKSSGKQPENTRTW